MKESLPSKTLLSNNLNANDILMAEFNYAMQTASQANEDRVKVFSFVIANVGTFIAAVLLPILNADINIIIFGFIFLILSLLGVFSVFQLTRLRLAWIDSVKTMNKIKDFYINNLPKLNLTEAFRWKTGTIPQVNKVNSLAFLLTITIIFLDSFSLAAGAFILWESVLLAVVLAIIFGISQVFYWVLQK